MAEGSLMTDHVHNNTTKNETKNAEKQSYVPPEERRRQAGDRGNDEEDTRRLSLSNIPTIV